MGSLFIGLMSGTSMDGIDAALASFDEKPGKTRLWGHQHASFDPSLRQSLAALNIPGANELHHAEIAANALAASYAEVIATLLAATGVSRNDICALGAHGQTIRHQPGLHDATGYTIQLLNGARLAELSGIDVVCDFRSREVAAGGQGAPLVPAFHQAMFTRPNHATAVVNIGGFSNLTFLDTNGSVGGFDCGPGNVLLDMWCEQHLGLAYDDNGEWSAGGEVDPDLLAAMLNDPYFHKPLPKSTGRDLFNRAWLTEHLDTCSSAENLQPRDIQSTLAELTVSAIAQGVRQYLPHADQLLICGGGAFNTDLCKRLQRNLPTLTLKSTSCAGIPPMQVEAMAFAWLAKRFIERLPGNCSDVTGALGTRVLGCLYPK